MTDKTPINYEDVIKAIDNFEKLDQEIVNKKPDVIIPYYTLDHLATELSQAKAEIKQYEKALHDQIIKDYDMELELKAELEKKDKRISDLEFALMDMVLQFADESKNSINTMGLSALEIAFNELDFDNPMSIKEVHERYKKLAQKYYK